MAQGGPVNAAAPTNGLAVLGDLNSMLANYGMSVSPSGTPTDTIAMQVINDPGECNQYYGNDVIEKNRCLCDNFPDAALGQGIDCSPYTPIYWYHPDYIGNVEFVSDRTGQPYQHFYYAPFGDPMVSQHVGTGSFNSAFRFNAKEYDEETGNYYYGARYYEPKSSVWMGVDALATSYPGMNPYNFTMGNPIMAIDPDGNEVSQSNGDDGIFLDSDGNVVGDDGIPDDKVYVPKTRNRVFRDISGVNVVCGAHRTRTGQKNAAEFVKENSGNAQAFSENQWVYDEYVALPGLKIHRNRAISHADAVFGSNPELESSFNAAQYPGGELKEVPNIGDQPLPGAKEASVDMEYAHMDGSFTLEQLYLFIFHAHPETINGKPAVQFPSPDDIDEANHGGIEHRIRVVYSPARGKVYLYDHSGIVAVTTLTGFLR